MKNKESFFSRLRGGLESWVHFVMSDDSYDTQERSFKDPYADLDYLHDKEMERLVKALENTQNDSIRYQ